MPNWIAGKSGAMMVENIDCCRLICFFAVLLLVVSLLIYEIARCTFKKDDFHQIPYSIGSIFACFAVVCCWWEQIWKSPFIAVALAFLYAVFVMASKTILAFSTLGKCKINKDKFWCFLRYNSQLLFVSPDFFFTALCKDAFWDAKFGKRARLIWLYNIENLLFSFILVFAFSSSWFFGLSPIVSRIFLSLLGIRIVSRSIEVAVSFLKDVCRFGALPSSSLKVPERVGLSFLSILEMVILAFGVSFCSGRFSFTSSAGFAFSLVSSISINGSLGGVEMAHIFCGLSCFSLVGVVIGSYLGKRNRSVEKAKSESPQLFVYSNKDVKNVLLFEPSDRDANYCLDFINEPNWFYRIDNRGSPVFVSAPECPSILQQTNSGFNLVGGTRFVIRLDSKTQRAEIFKIE